MYSTSLLVANWRQQHRQKTGRRIGNANVHNDVNISIHARACMSIRPSNTSKKSKTNVPLPQNLFVGQGCGACSRSNIRIVHANMESTNPSVNTTCMCTNFMYTSISREHLGCIYHTEVWSQGFTCKLGEALVM